MSLGRLSPTACGLKFFYPYFLRFDNTNLSGFLLFSHPQQKLSTGYIQLVDKLHRCYSTAVCLNFWHVARTEMKVTKVLKISSQIKPFNGAEPRRAFRDSKTA